MKKRKNNKNVDINKISKKIEIFRFLHIFNSSEKIIEEYDSSGTKPLKVTKEYQSKTVWDILQIILIPIALAFIGFWFTAKQQQTTIQVSNNQHETDLKIAQDQQRENALNSYITDMSNLLINYHLDKNSIFVSPQPNNIDTSINSVARIKTLTVLPRLDPKRKVYVLEFISQSGLIDMETQIFDLVGADFSHITLTAYDAYLPDKELKGINFSNSYIQDIDFDGSDFMGTIFSNAVFMNDDLNEVSISQRANLSNTIFKNDSMVHAGFILSDFYNTKFVNTNLTNSQIDVLKMKNALFDNSDLSGAEFSDVDFKNAQFKNVDMRKVNFREGNNLKNAQFDLTDTFTPKQIKEFPFLKGKVTIKE